MTGSDEAAAAALSPPIDAIVSPWEADGVEAAVRLLDSYLGGGCARLVLRDFDRPLSPSPGGLVVLSMSCALEGGEPMDQVAARYAAHIADGRRAGSAAISLLTVFQHVPGPDDAGRRDRIRRLNLLAARLSHETGVTVADIDRALSLFGAREIGTTFELVGPLAQDVVAHVLVQAWLSLGLGPGVPEPVQAAAWAAHGGMAHMDRLERRLAARGR